MPIIGAFIHAGFRLLFGGGARRRVGRGGARVAASRARRRAEAQEAVNIGAANAASTMADTSRALGLVQPPIIGYATGLDSRFPHLSSTLGAAVALAVRKAAFDVQAAAKQNAPVDTGALRNSIGVEMTGPFTAEVSTALDYAEAVEYGTSTQAAQPYMTPAAEKVRKSLERAIGAAIERSFR